MWVRTACKAVVTFNGDRNGDIDSLIEIVAELRDNTDKLDHRFLR